MTPAEYHDRLQACLDARQDPLDDAALCTFLSGHPDELERFAALRCRLAALPACGDAEREPAVARPRRRWPLARRAALAAALVAAAVLVPRPAAVTQAASSGRGRVLAASLAPLPMRQYAAASFFVRQRLCAGPATYLETFELRSERR